MRNQERKSRNKFTHHYRFLVRDTDSKKIIFSFRLNLLNGCIALALFTLLIITCTVLALRYTPIKSYFISEPISEVEYKNKLLELHDKISAIEQSVQNNDLYIQSIQAVVSGKIRAVKVDSLMARTENPKLEGQNLKASEEDSLFRAQVAKEEIEALAKNNKSAKSDLFFVPVKGIITSKYSPSEKHLAIDIAAKRGESIKAIASGTVIYNGWNPETGYTLILRHNNDVISVYKHCGKLFKSDGSTVTTGEAIASVGNSGELTTGPHLHFELWIGGKSVNPEEYINF